MFSRIKSFLLENKTTKQTVAKNTIWLSISNFGGRIIKAAIVIYGARVLGTAGYGVFSYATTLAGFFTLFVDPGINAVLVREGAKATPEERHSLFSTTLVMKAVIIAVSVAAVVTIAPLFSTLPGAKELLPFAALIIIFDSIREFLSSLFRSEEKMQWDAASFLSASIGIVVFGFIFLKISATPLFFTKAYVVGTAIGAFVAISLSRKSFHKILHEASLKRMGFILKTAWPFAITSVLGTLFTTTDVLIISWMKTASDVGIYSAVIRIVQLLYLIPMVIQMSTLPIFSRLAKNDPEKFRATLEQIVSFIFLISVPLSLGGIILGGQIMHLIFGSAYAVGGITFSIFMIGLSFDYAANIVGGAIFAYDHQKSLIVSSAIGGIANVLLDLLLIPHWGMEGSAIATLFSQIFSNTYLWYAMKKLNNFSIFDGAKKIIVSGVIMALATTLLWLAGINVVINILISGVVYFGMLFALKEPAFGEIKKIFISTSI